MSFETTEYMLKDIFDYSKFKRFRIPDFQRNYTWGWNECEKLWNNIFSYYEQSNSEEACCNYFLGSIIVYKDARNINAQPPEVNVIDGQQRITTLLLLFRAIYQVISNKLESNESSSETEFIENLKDTKKAIEKTFCQQISLKNGCIKYDINKHRIIRTNYRNNNIDPITDILANGSIVITDNDKKIDYINDDENLKTFLHEKYIRNTTKRGKKRNLQEALIYYLESCEYTNYAFFVDKVKALDTNIIAFTGYLLEKCIFLCITPPNESYAFTVFDILNNTGIPLEPSDIVKNYIFELAYNKNNTRFRNNIGDLWRQLDENCNRIINDKKILDVNEVLKNFMNITRVTSGEYGIGWSLSKDPNIRDYFSRDKKEIFPRGYTTLRDESLVDTMNTLIGMSDFLIHTITPENQYNDALDQLISLQARQDIQIIQLLNTQNNIKYNYLFSLFWYQHRNNLTRKKTFIKKFNKFIRFCSSYLALTAIIAMDESSDIVIGDGIVPKLCEMFVKRESANRDTRDAKKYIVLTELDKYIEKSKELLSSGPIIKKLNFLPLIYCYHAFPNQSILSDPTVEHILPEKWKQMHLLRAYQDEIKTIARSQNIDNVPRFADQEATRIRQSRNINTKIFEDYIDDCVQMLGNKMMMEKKPNLAAQNCVFNEKIKRYNEVHSLLTLENINLIDNYSKNEDGSSKTVWSIHDIAMRNERMINVIIDYIRSGIKGGIA